MHNQPVARRHIIGLTKQKMFAAQETRNVHSNILEKSLHDVSKSRNPVRVVIRICSLGNDFGDTFQSTKYIKCSIRELGDELIDVILEAKEPCDAVRKLNQLEKMQQNKKALIVDAHVVPIDFVADLQGIFDQKSLLLEQSRKHHHLDALYKKLSQGRRILAGLKSMEEELARDGEVLAEITLKLREISATQTVDNQPSSKKSDSCVELFLGCATAVFGLLVIKEILFKPN